MTNKNWNTKGSQMDKTTQVKIDNLCNRGYQNVEDFHDYEPEQKRRCNYIDKYYDRYVAKGKV